MNAIDTFFDAWGEADADARAAAIAGATSETFSYADPRTPDAITGQDALIDYVGMFVAAAPGATARVVNLSTTLGVHRATIAFVMADGKEQLGQYMIELDAAGKITRFVGFAGLGAPE